MPTSKPSPSARVNLWNHWLARYVFALLAVAAGFLLRFGLTRLAGGSLPTYITFYPVVMLSALIGGVGPGLLATVAAALGVDYFLLPPFGSFAVGSLADAVGLAFFSGMGIFMSVVAELYRRARQQAAAYEAEAYSRDHLEAPARWSKQGLLLNAGLAVALTIMAVAGWQSAQSLRTVEQADNWVTHTHAVIQGLDRLLSALKDEETGQRGYLLTGEEKYLAPYQAALAQTQTNLADLKQLTQDNVSQQQRLASLQALIVAKEGLIKQTLELRRTQGLPAALELVISDQGMNLMDQIRMQIAVAQDDEARLLQQRAATKAADTAKTLQALLAGSLLSFLLLTTVFLYLKQENSRRTKAESEVRQHRDHLQDIVAARTEELSRSNEQLKNEIHGHQQAREALRQQREWLHVTLTSIGDGVLATDIAGQITFLNPVAESLTGWRESEVLGRPAQSVFRIINQQTRAPGEDIVARVLREGQIVALANHTALLARDGREIPIEDSAAPIRDAGGTVSGVVLVFHDVTQKRRAQEALLESQRQNEFLAGIIERSSQAFGVGYPDGRLGLINQAFERLTGYDREELRSINWNEALTPPEWREKERHKLEELARTGKPVRYEKEYARKDGIRVPVELLVGVEKGDGGQPLYYYSFLTDITERKRVETVLQTTLQRFYDVLGSMSCGIMLVADDGRVEFANQELCGLFGLVDAPADLAGLASRDMVEKLAHGYLHPVQALARIQEVVDRGEPIKGEEIALAGGRTCLRDFVPLQVHGKSCGRLWLHFDITARKRAEEAIQANEKKYRDLFENMTEEVHFWRLVYDEKGRIKTWRLVDANPPTLKTWGKTLAEIRGKTTDEIFGPGATEHYMPVVNKVMTEGVPHAYEDYFPNLGRHFRFTTVPLKDHFITTGADISSIMRAEAARAQLAAIVESSEDAVLSKDLDGMITSWNAGAGRLFGYRPEEVIGHSIKVLLPPERQDEETAIMVRLQAGERVDHFETVRVAKDGRSLPVSVTISPIKDGEGRVIGASKIARDITERKQKEEELQRLNRTLKALRESSQAMTRATSEKEYLDEVCKVVIANCGHAMVWIGIAEEDQARSVRPAAFAGFGEGYIETLKVSWADTERGRGPTGTAIRTGKPFLCGKLLANPNMAPWREEILKRGYASSLVVPLLSQDKAFGAITIYSLQTDRFSEDEVRLLAELADDVSNCIRSLRAVSRRRRAERRTELLAEAAGRLLNSDDPQRIVEELCGKVVEFLDCQIFFSFLVDEKQQRLRLNACAGIPQPETEKLEWLDCCAVLCGSAARDGCRLVAGNIQETPDPRTELLRPYGIEAYACHPLMVAGTLLGTLSFATRTRKNFTEEELSFMKAAADLVATAIERKRAHAALQLTAEEVKRSNHDLEQFAYIASHDLQEPLRAVGGYVKLLQRRFPQDMDPKALEYIQGAIEGADRMERLISDLLAFSRVGTRGGAFSTANLNAILKEALQNLRVSIQSTQAKITCDAMPSLAADGTQVMQIFQNLIGNAIKFRSERPPEIHVGVQQQPGRWVFSVRDNGIGIEPQYFERIFQIFQRLHTRKHYPGTGIGLAICKKMVERHDGAIWVESELGQGSTFYFSLPETSAIVKA